MEAISNYQKDLPLKARAAINLMEKLQKEMIVDSQKIEQSIALADGAGIGNASMSGMVIVSVFDLDKQILDFCDSFLNNLYDVLAHVNNLMCTKMEKNAEFDAFEKY